MALISMRLRSCARIVAFCFFVPKVSPSAFLASRYWVFDGAADEGIDFKALTVWVNIWGALGTGRIERDPVRLLWTARRYLSSHWYQRTGHEQQLNAYRHPEFAAFLLSSSLDTNSTLFVSPTTNNSSASASSLSLIDVVFVVFRFFCE